MKGQRQQGRLNDAIQSTKSFLRIGTAEYTLAQTEIATALLEHLESENQAVQSTALDTFFRETEFLKAAQVWETLKLRALKVSLNLSLPELVTAIQRGGEAISSDLKLSIEQARILLALKAKTFGAAEYQSASALTLKGLEAKILDYAMIHSDMSLAKLALNDLEENDRKSSYEINVAWLEQNWSKAQDLSERQSSNDVLEVNSKEQDLEMAPSNNQGDTSILEVLSKPAIGSPVLEGAKWRATLSSQLIDLEEQIKISKAFLNHG